MILINDKHERVQILLTCKWLWHERKIELSMLSCHKDPESCTVSSLRCNVLCGFIVQTI